MYYLFIMRRFVYIGKKIPGLRAFLDSNLHTRRAIVTANELGLAFPPRNLPKKLRPDPSTFCLVIVATNRQTDSRTDKQTNQRQTPSLKVFSLKSLDSRHTDTQKVIGNFNGPTLSPWKEWTTVIIEIESELQKCGLNIVIVYDTRGK